MAPASELNAASETEAVISSRRYLVGMVALVVGLTMAVGVMLIPSDYVKPEISPKIYQPAAEPEESVVTTQPVEQSTLPPTLEPEVDEPLPETRANSFAPAPVAEEPEVPIELPSSGPQAEDLGTTTTTCVPRPLGPNGERYPDYCA